MLDTDVYLKTDAGREEIRSRTLGLSMAARAILLMVDGQRTVAAMRTLIAGSKASADVLDTLASQGLIAPRAPATAPPFATPPPAPAAKAAPQAPAAVAPPPVVQPVREEFPIPAPRPPEVVAAATMRGMDVPAAARVAADHYTGPIDLVLPTILGPEAGPPEEAAPQTMPPVFAYPPPAEAPALPVLDRYEHLYGMMNEIVRDFLAPHRRYFFQLKIERCTTADELLELLHALQTTLAKARGEAFASDVIARLRAATA